MAVTSDVAITRAQPSAAALPLLVGATVYVVLMSVGAKLLNDPDTYWHTFVGNWILAHGLPWTDPFSFTFAGKPWIAKEWLSQVILGTAQTVGGWALVVAVTAAAAALAFGLLARFLADRVAPLPAIAFVVAAFVLAAPHMLARPHLLALPVMVAWTAGLARASDEGRSPRYAMLPLMVLWANLHAGFTLGLVLLVAFGLDAVWSAGRAERSALAKRWAIFAALALLAGMVTPYGPQSMMVTFQVLNLGPALSIIGEWKPADFSHVGALEVILLGSAGLAAWRGFTLPPVRILILLGLLHLALSAVRNGEILGLLAPLVLAGPVARQFPALRAPAPLPAIGRAIPLALLLVLVPVTLGLAGVENYRPSPAITPSGAVAALKAGKYSRVFNDYDFGGYLISAGIAPFIDGRTELYGGAFTARQNRAVTLGNLDDFLKMLDTYQIDATLLAPAMPAVALLDRLPGWMRLYSDDIAVVHVRVPERPALPGNSP